MTRLANLLAPLVLIAAVTHAALDASLRWIDVLGVSMLAGIGFTVSLLIGDLAYDPGSAREAGEHLARDLALDLDSVHARKRVALLDFFGDLADGRVDGH